MNILLALAAILLAAPSPGQMQAVGFENVTIDDPFWSPRVQKHKDVTMNVCIDQIENRTGRIRNFENAAKGEGKHSGIYFDDSDVYKALEGFAYSLQNCPDPALEAKCDEWIDKFAAAQREDGYINTYYTLTGLQNRWTNMDKHEMYCAGHMIEAAVAYYNVTGKRKLLDVSEKMVAHMMSVFGPGKRDWVPGHEEIELALVKLWRATGKEEYLHFAEWLLNERGHGHGSHGNGKVWKPQYYQDVYPVREMRSISGHAVRSMYLYCGMADVAAVTGDSAMIKALDALWEDVVMRNMYLTGGIGQSKSNEGFTADWSLPNATAYCETCASVGMVFWNSRMNRMKGDAKYVDVMERSLYNGVLSGISLAGDKFFYVNPLESAGNHHRKDWYGCACCPSQLCRFLPSVGGYIYAASDAAVWVNLFIGGSADISTGGRKLTLTQETRYPWDGDVQINVGTDRPVKREIRVRIPGWCRDWSLSVNGKEEDCDIEKGYAVLSRKWRNGDRISLHMDMPVRVVSADPRVKEDEGLVAVQRGPVVYCMEEIDNAVRYDNAVLSPTETFNAVFEPDVLGGIVTLTTADSLRFIPYYAWDNREPSRMKVWVTEGTPRNADIVFVVEKTAAPEDDMSGAIIGATASGAGCATHVGIIERNGDSDAIFVIDAAPRHGVSRRLLDEFAKECATTPDTKIVVMRMPRPLDDESVITMARSLIGMKYDYTFLPDNDSWYCSEFVQTCFKDASGKPMFESHPMSFKDSEGNVPEYWKNLFERLEMPVPEGVPGTNPDEMMRSGKLSYVLTL